VAADIFLSYNREDQAVARRFAEAFEREGLTVWWDVTLRSGDAYDAVTESALKAAKAVAVLWSARSVESRWVRAEATLADRRRTLVPALIEPCERPIMFELTQTADLIHWRGEPGDQAWRAYVADVKRFVAREAPPQQQEAPATAAPQALAAADVGDMPTLAVLPFVNRSCVDDDEVFADGMVEDIIAALAQGAGVRILGSTATARLKAVAITDLEAIGRQLGVDYLLEGSVRRVGANLRVATQVLKAAGGEVVWSGRFDRPLAELAALQEELVLDVAAALGAQVMAAEMTRALAKPAGLTAWEARVRVLALLRNMDGPNLVRAASDAQKLIDIAPEQGAGYALLAVTKGLIYFVSSPDDPDAERRIRELFDRAIDLSPDDPAVATQGAFCYCCIGAPEEGLPYGLNAVRKWPGNGIAHHGAAVASSMLNRTAEALAHCEAAERLMPGLPWAHYAASWRGNTLVRAGRIEDAQAAYDHCLALNPHYWPAWQHKAVHSWRQGRRDEARSIFRRLKDNGNWPPHRDAWLRRVFVGSPYLDDILAAVRVLEQG
jgi:TolB-like protein